MPAYLLAMLCFVSSPCRVTVVEAKELLGTFDGSLREYAARKLVAQGVKLRKVRLVVG
jgi:NADH:ubiquinone reductase (non-electrogenic)